MVPVDQLAHVVSAEPAGEDEALSRLRAEGIVSAMDQLTDDQRAVLLLRALADLPVKEIATIVGKPESAVKALLRRGVAALARCLDELEEQGTA